MDEKENLEVKIGSKSEAEWTTMKKIQEQNIITGNVNLAIAKTVLELCERKIEEEKKNFTK